MNRNLSDLPVQWQWANMSAEDLEKRSQWLEARRQLGSGCEYYFHMAGKLLSLAIDDYYLIVPVFYQTIIGLERALRVHFKAEDECYGADCIGSTDPFSDLFHKVVEEGTIHDGFFQESTHPEEGGLKALIRDGKSLHGKIIQPATDQTYSQRLAHRIPELRNNHFHGNGSSLMPGLLEVALDLRIITDTLKTKGIQSLLY